MPLPGGITTRTVTLGPGVTLEAGEPLAVRVKIKASRDLVWAATGTAVRSVEKTIETDTAGLELSFPLPVTDQEGWLLNGQVVDVSGGKQSHYYVLTVEFLSAVGRTVSSAAIGPFSVPTGDGSPVDADKLIPAETAGGATISIPDAWSEAVTLAQQAAAEAAAAMIDSDAFMAEKATDPGSAFSAALSASNAQAIADDPEYAGTPAEAVDDRAAAAFLKGGVILLANYPRQGGETHDSPALTRALADAAALGARIIEAGASDYTFNTKVDVTIDNLTIRGAGRRATRFRTGNDITIFNITANHVSVERAEIDVTNVGRTVFPVIFNNCKHSAVRDCYFNGADGARVSGVYFKDTGSASTGQVRDCFFNHSCIRIETWDVGISETYVWAMSCDYGVGVFNGAGNWNIHLEGLVPPLLSTPTGIAGLLVDGASGKSLSGRGDIYLDGNPTLTGATGTRQGVYIGDGSGDIALKVEANKMDSDCVVIDSAYSIAIDYHGSRNNQSGNGAVDVRVKQTGTQPVEKIRITGQCSQTEAVTGTAGPAIKVESSVTQANQVSIDVDVKQPSAGGGYTVPEIDVPVVGGYPTQRLGRSRGQLSVYRAADSQAVASGATSATINLGSPRPMAYRPRPSQIQLSMESGGATLPPYRMTYTTDNQIFVAFASATSAAGTLHWRAHLD